jgi:hypothetical protein
LQWNGWQLFIEETDEVLKPNTLLQEELFVTERIVDRDENIHIADTLNNRIRRVDAATGIITTVAGNGLGAYSGDGGTAVNAALKAPQSVSKSPAGDLYIADTSNYCVRKVNGVTGIISTYAGTPSISISSSD